MQLSQPFNGSAGQWYIYGIPVFAAFLWQSPDGFIKVELLPTGGT
jgi:hypothetical protein